MRVAKTKALISFAVTAKLICVFVFAYAECWFSHAAAQLVFLPLYEPGDPRSNPFFSLFLFFFFFLCQYKYMYLNLQLFNCNALDYFVCKS